MPHYWITFVLDIYCIKSSILCSHS